MECYKPIYMTSRSANSLRKTLSVSFSRSPADSTERLEAFPDVSTFAELGYDEITSLGVRRVLVSPTGADPEILNVEGMTLPSSEQAT